MKSSGRNINMTQILLTINMDAKKKHAEYMKQYWKDNPDKYQAQQLKAKQYRQSKKYKSKRKEYDQKYLSLHPENRKQSVIKYNETHREQKREYDNRYSKENYTNNREQILAEKRQWRIDNPDLAREQDRLYRLKYPERILKNALRQMARNADKVNMLKYAYRNAQKAWSNAVKNKDEHTCIVCGNPSEFSHHLLYRSKYPQLQFIINNGVALCKGCHLEVHSFDKRWNQQ